MGNKNAVAATTLVVGVTLQIPRSGDDPVDVDATVSYGGDRGMSLLSADGEDLLDLPALHPIYLIDYVAFVPEATDDDIRTALREHGWHVVPSAFSGADLGDALSFSGATP